MLYIKTSFKLQFTYLSKFLPRLAKEKEKKRFKVKKGKIHTVQKTAAQPHATNTETQAGLVVMKHRSDHSSLWDRETQDNIKQTVTANESFNSAR